MVQVTVIGKLRALRPWAPLRNIVLFRAHNATALILSFKLLWVQQLNKPFATLNPFYIMLA